MSTEIEIDLAQWALDTTMLAIELAVDGPLPYSVKNVLAKKESLKLLVGITADSGVAANREFVKRIIRRAQQIINDGIAVGSVS